MAKRKRDNFTAEEVVSNRFDAREGTNERSGVGSTSLGAEADHPTGPVTEYGVRATGIVPASVHIDPPTGQAVDTDCWPCWSPSAATRETGSLGGTSTEPATAGNEAQLDSTWATEVEGWLASAKTPITERPARPVELQAEDSVERHNQTVKAFWALLKQAGYEEV